MPNTDVFEGVRVEAHSPDDSISARLSAADGLSLDYHPAGLDHGDEGLERQLRYVLSTLIVDVTNAMSTAGEQAYGDRRPPIGDDLDSRIALARAERAVALLADFEAVESSADGGVRIRLSADGSVDVDIAYGAVDEYGGDHLVVEAALATRRLFAAQAARFNEVHDIVVNKLSRGELEEQVRGNRY